MPHRTRRRHRPLLIRALLCAVIAGALSPLAARAVPINVVYGDDPGEGFNDPSLGAARRAAMDFAAAQWADTLAGDVPIVIDAFMDPLGGSGSGALLASTRATTLHRNFTGGQPGIWYGAALANEISDTDLNGPDQAEIEIHFNSDVDGPDVLGSISWYYGTDGQPGADVDMVSVTLHELGHGLNFFDTIDDATGDFVFSAPSIFDLQLERPGVGSVESMLPRERLAAITSGALFWDGPAVLAAFGGPVPLYAPYPFVPGSSISHWDPSLTPDELMEPFYTGPNHNPGLLLPALEDMGWTLTVPTPTPRPYTPPPTPTPTRTPRNTPTPPPFSHQLAYVSNFGADDVSVIDTDTLNVVGTVAVDTAPLGVAAAPDGRWLYVANFGAGTVSRIDTSANRVTDTVRTGGTPHSIAVSPDGATVYASNTERDSVAVIDPAAGVVAQEIPVGQQPGALALLPDLGRALVANFGDDDIGVIDTDSNAMRAIIGLDPNYFNGVSSIAVTPGGTTAYATSSYSGYVYAVDVAALTRQTAIINLSPYMDAVAIHPADGRIYFAETNQTFDVSYVYAADANAKVKTVVSVDYQPRAMAFNRDGSLLFVANAGADTVSVIRTDTNRVTATIPVGPQPMGIAVVSVPQSGCAGDCNGDGTVSVDELVLGLRVALGQSPLSACVAADASGDSRVTVDELVTATANALDGCRGR